MINKSHRTYALVAAVRANVGGEICHCSGWLVEIGVL